MAKVCMIELQRINPKKANKLCVEKGREHYALVAFI